METCLHCWQPDLLMTLAPREKRATPATRVRSRKRQALLALCVLAGAVAGITVLTSVPDAAEACDKNPC